MTYKTTIQLNVDKYTQMWSNNLTQFFVLQRSVYLSWPGVIRKSNCAFVFNQISSQSQDDCDVHTKLNTACYHRVTVLSGIMSPNGAAERLKQHSGGMFAHTLRHTQTHARANITSRSTSQNKMAGDKESERVVRMRRVGKAKSKTSKKDMFFCWYVDFCLSMKRAMTKINKILHMSANKTDSY